MRCLDLGTGCVLTPRSLTGNWRIGTKVGKVGRGVGGGVCLRGRRGFPFTTAGSDRKRAVKAEWDDSALLQMLADTETDTGRAKSILRR